MDDYYSPQLQKLKEDYKALEQENQRLKEENLRIRNHAIHCVLENAFLRDGDGSGSLEEILDTLPDSIDTEAFVLLMIYAGGDLPESPTPLRQAEEYHIFSNIFQELFGQVGLPIVFGLPDATGCLLMLRGVTAQDADQFSRQLTSEVSSIAVYAVKRLEEMGIKRRIAVSPVQGGLEAPKKLYREALLVKEYGAGLEGPVLSKFDLESPAQPGHIKDAAALERQFMNYVLTRDFLNAVNTFDDILLLQMSKDMAPLDQVKSSVFLRLDTVMSLCELDLTPQVDGDTELFRLLESLMRKRSFEGLVESVHDFFAELDDILKQKDTASKTTLITDFIEKNFQNPNMGAAFICDHFKFSYSYLGRVFKRDLGMGVVDYIHSVRLNKAKQLLIDTDLTVEAVAEQSGFSNRWTFMRSFRAAEGITPSQYRQVTK